MSVVLCGLLILKTQPEQDILNNNCFGGEYNEEENVSDVDFMIKFLELLPKDMKYFLEWL